MDDQSWACHGGLEGQLYNLQCAAGVVVPALGAVAGLGRWFVGVAVFAALCSFPVEQAPLGNHSAQTPASVWVASPGHIVGHYKAKCSLYSVQQVWWSLHWVLRQGWAGGLWGLRFCLFLEFF